jgi:small-conductance mechanosensitive channel
LAAIFVAAAAICAEVVRRALKSWLRRLADANPTELGEVLAASLPRPLAVATFLAALSFGARLLPVSSTLTMAFRHVLPFAAGVIAVVVMMRVGLRSIDAFGKSNPALKASAGVGKAAAWVGGLALIAVLVSDALGISLAPALTALGVGTLAVALALQDTLANFFAGIYLLVDKPVRPGDFVRLESGHEGYVDSIGWRSTQIKTLIGSWVIVPNATLSKAVLANFRGANPRLVLEIRVDVAHGSDVPAVERALDEVAKSVHQIRGVLTDPAPYARFHPGFTDVSLAFTVYSKLDPSADSVLVGHDIRNRIAAQLAKAGIALAMSPRAR